MNECEAFGLSYGLGIPLLCICILCVTKRRGTTMTEFCVGDDNRLPAFGMLVILTGFSLFVARLGGATAAGLEIAGGVLCCVGSMARSSCGVRQRGGRRDLRRCI